MMMVMMIDGIRDNAFEAWGFNCFEEDGLLVGNGFLGAKNINFFDMCLESVNYSLKIRKYFLKYACVLTYLLTELSPS
jgi:hypothetical protein